MRRRQPSATVQVYQCPKHAMFTTLVVNDTRFGTSKCCPAQYAKLVREWRLDARDVEDFCEALQDSLDEAMREEECARRAEEKEGSDGE